MIKITEMALTQKILILGTTTPQGVVVRNITGEVNSTNPNGYGEGAYNAISDFSKFIFVLKNKITDYQKSFVFSPTNLTSKSVRQIAIGYDTVLTPDEIDFEDGVIEVESIAVSNTNYSCLGEAGTNIVRSIVNHVEFSTTYNSIVAPNNKTYTIVQYLPSYGAFILDRDLEDAFEVCKGGISSTSEPALLCQSVEDTLLIGLTQGVTGCGTPQNIGKLNLLYIGMKLAASKGNYALAGSILKSAKSLVNLICGCSGK